MMDILYQLFYTVFSMSCMALVLLPVVLLFRFVFRGHSGKITMALWGILFAGGLSVGNEQPGLPV